MKPNRLLAILAAAVIGCLSALAQNGTMTPYSRYGYGILGDNATSSQRAMGGVGYAMNSGRQINVMNPASYAAIDSLTFLFDMGIDLRLLHASEGDTKENNINGGLDYITFSFPISKRIGAAVGMLPYASTGYAFLDKISNGSTSHAGNGDINQVFVGAGVNPAGGLYAGFNFGYLFGNTLNDVYAYTITGSTSLFERYIKVQDWHLDLGVQYSQNFNDSRVTLGLNWSPAKDLHGETFGLYYNVPNTNASVKPDTIGYSKLKGKYSLPATYGAGINYQWRNRLTIEADFTYQPWKDAKYAAIEDFEQTEFSNRWKAAVGMQYVPSPRGSYAGRIQYRLGGYYNHDYLMIRGNNVKEFGLTFGLGLPVPQFKTIINLGVEYKRRHTSPVSLIKENYVNITLGVNFNEMWFRKSKIY